MPYTLYNNNNLMDEIYMPEFLKTGLAKIRTPTTTWQLKKIKFVQRPIKKPIYDAGQYVYGP